MCYERFLEFWTSNMMNLHIEDHTLIVTIAPRPTIVFRQRIIESTCWVLFNPLHNTTKLGIGIGIIHISDRNSNTRVPLNILILPSGGSGREFEMLSIPQKPHGR